MKEGVKKLAFRIKKRYVSLAILIILFGIASYSVIANTGFLQFDDIDERDMERWVHDENGLIEGTDSFVLEGDKDICWMLIHGYGATPDEMKEMGEMINTEFGDYVYVPRLKGHGELPSQIINLTLDDWYLQVEKDFEELNLKCGKVNVLGFSFGGALTLKLAEEKNLNNVYLVDVFLKTAHRWYYGISGELYLKLFANSFLYVKKSQIAQINSLEGKENYIAYWNFPIRPVKNSFEFLKVVEEDVEKVDEPIFILHSLGDRTASVEAAQEVFNGVSSKIKKIVIYEKSNHVLLVDYDKKDAMNQIINFEMENRNEI